MCKPNTKRLTLHIPENDKFGNIYFKLTIGECMWQLELNLSQFFCIKILRKDFLSH